MEFTEKFFEEMQKNPIYDEILRSRLQLIKLFVKFVYGGYFLLFISAFTCIFITYALTGTYVYVSPIYFPYIDHQSGIGFIINTVLLMYITFLGILSFLTHDGLVILYGCQTIIYVDILSSKLDDLKILLRNDQVKMEGEMMETKQPGARELLIEVIKLQMDLSQCIELNNIHTRIPR
jgi:7tm Odorant receptor